MKRVLALNETPDRIVVFIPPECEAKLPDQELKFKGLAEDKIVGTAFTLRSIGGKLWTTVSSQTAG